MDINTKQRLYTIIFLFVGWAHSLQRFKVNASSNELIGRQLQDTYVRQRLSEGGVLLGDSQLPEIRHESEPMPNRHRRKEDKAVSYFLLL